MEKRNTAFRYHFFFSTSIKAGFFLSPAQHTCKCLCLLLCQLGNCLHRTAVKVPGIYLCCTNRHRVFGCRISSWRAKFVGCSPVDGQLVALDQIESSPTDRVAESRPSQCFGIRSLIACHFTAFRPATRRLHAKTNQASLLLERKENVTMLGDYVKRSVLNHGAARQQYCL